MRADCSWLFLAPLAFAGLLALGCDGYVGIHGKAYRWGKAPKTPPSVLLIDKGDSAPVPEGLEPLEDVKITIYSSPEDALVVDKTDLPWTTTTRSGTDGAFEDGMVCAPGSYDMALRASHPGCQSVLQTFRHPARHPPKRSEGGFEHEVAIILSCPGLEPKAQSKER